MVTGVVPKGTGVKKGDKDVDLIASLCKIYDASEDELRATMDKTNNLIETILKKKPSACQTDKLDNIDTDGLTYFEDLLDETSISTSLITLEKDYTDAVCNKSELDERVFINEEDSLLGSGSLSAGAVNITGVKRKIDSLSSPARTFISPLSPHKSPAAKTNSIGISVEEREEEKGGEERDDKDDGRIYAVVRRRRRRKTAEDEDEDGDEDGNEDATNDEEKEGEAEASGSNEREKERTKRICIQLRLFPRRKPQMREKRTK
ncbi:hypothetical protein HID58_048900 [Brassica napus]|uniref:Uncharacterized protein n=1 Tax=Brassica napus TaxID=3708 RepID=A0ABQ8B4A2_BRANA|nr:hypothetical protein HID58_048900 [Brassica napus]